MPGQPAAVGVIVYTAVPAAEVVAVSVCAMVDPDEAEAPLTFVCETVQLNVVPLTLLVSAMEVALPEHRLEEEGVAVALGVGFTVTVTTTGEPAQPAAAGVIV